MDTAKIIEALRLTAHPEGGYYRETFRDPCTVTMANGQVRSASTAIYYLLPADTFSAFHRTDASEVWHWYGGGPLRLFLLREKGAEPLLLDASSPQAVVPADVWQAAEPLDGAVLCGCTVAPAFEFSAFVLGERDVLRQSYPDAADVIQRLTRSP
jgi:predicted cupin superfamily sugar epimerase